MNNLPLQPLVWTEISEKVRSDPSVCELDKGALWIADDNLVFRYNIKNNPNSKELPFIVNYGGRQPKEVDSVEYGKHWAEFTHYASHMQPYVKPDSITDIANWFKASKPEPTFNDYMTQLGCHFEEVCEMMAAIGGGNEDICIDLSEKADFIKGLTVPDEYVETQKSFIDNIELLDALCDQIVTATGVAYMMGFDIDGALKEVIRSNNSKMVDGKFEFDTNGKIARPDSYSEPDLTPFISTMQNMHKGDK